MNEVKLFNLSMPKFPNEENGDDNSINILKLA